MSFKISTVGIVIAVVVAIGFILIAKFDLNTIWQALGLGGGAGAAYETGMRTLAGREKKIDDKIAANTAHGEAKKEELKHGTRKDGANFFNNLFKRKGK